MFISFMTRNKKFYGWIVIVIVLLHKSGAGETKAESNVGAGAAKLECKG